MPKTSIAINCEPHIQLPNYSGGHGNVPSGPVVQDARLSLVKRAFSSKSLDELFFILTNDIRTVIEFDRASLITHVRGASRITATDNEPALNKRTEFVTKQNVLASALSDQTTALLLGNKTSSENWPDLPISLELKNALKSYREFSGFAGLLLIPLMHRQTLIGHLVLEFSSTTRPNDVEIHSFIDLAPVFAAALTEKITLSLKPELTALVSTRSSDLVHRSRSKKYGAFSVIGLMALILVFFVIPFPFTLSGEAQITSRISHTAFAGTEGILDKVLIKEGQRVDQGQLLACLDPKELNFQIMSWTAQRDILTHEMNRLVLEAGEKPSSLAEKRSVELKREATLAELRFLAWKKQLLEIRAPVSGIVITKDVHTLAGKRLRAGETFCEMAAPDELSAQVYVPEERISEVKVGQDVALYLNTSPTKAYHLKVDRIAPAPEVLPRIGTVFRVFAPLESSVDSLKVGMKGIGKVHLTEMTLWDMISYRLATRWNQLSLYL